MASIGLFLSIAAAGVFYGLYKSVAVLRPESQAGDIACWYALLYAFARNETFAGACETLLESTAPGVVPAAAASAIASL